MSTGDKVALGFLFVVVGAIGFTVRECNADIAKQEAEHRARCDAALANATASDSLRVLRVDSWCAR